MVYSTVEDSGFDVCFVLSEMEGQNTVSRGVPSGFWQFSDTSDEVTMMHLLASLGATTWTMKMEPTIRMARQDPN